MTTRSKSRRGAALAMVLIFTLVLSMLAAAIYTLFQSNAKTYSYVRDRIQARYTAESGVNLAVHMIMGGADVPQGIVPEVFLPQAPAVGYYEMPGEDLGRVRVVVDPRDVNAEISTANAYSVRALSRVGTTDSTYTYGLETLVLPENFSRFATFLNDPPTSGYYGDGYRFDGPFFANGPVCLYSTSASTSNDIWFYRFSLASDYYVYGTNSSGPHATTPIYGNLTVQPFSRMMLGAPYFELGVDPIPFGADEVNWEDTRDAAITAGLYFPPGAIPNNTRMILRGDSLLGDTLLVKTSNGATVQRYFIGDLANRVIWIDNGAGDRIYLKSYPPYSAWSTPISPEGITQPLTIGCNGSVYISGSLQYHDRDLLDEDNTTMLGLVIVYGNFTIALDPDLIGGTDWAAGEWHIVTNGDVEYDCIVMVLEGQFIAQDAHYPSPARDFMMVGGYIVNGEGITTIGTNGWYTVIYYDSRLMTRHPPFFPQTGRWDLAYWREWPEMTETVLEDNWN